MEAGKIMSDFEVVDSGFEVVSQDDAFEVVAPAKKAEEHPLSRPEPEFVKPPERNKYFEAVAAGAEQSVIGKFQAKPTPYEPESMAEGIAFSASKLVFDSPFYIYGAALGGPAGSFGLPAGLEKVAENKWEDKGFVQELGEATTETIKGAVVGKLMGGASQLKFTDKLVPGSVKKFLAEWGTLSAAAPAVEGETPTVDSVISNGIFLGGLKATTGAIKFVSEVSGKSAKDVVADVRVKAKETGRPEKEILAEEVKASIRAEIKAEAAKQYGLSSKALPAGEHANIPGEGFEVVRKPKVVRRPARDVQTEYFDKVVDVEGNEFLIRSPKTSNPAKLAEAIGKPDSVQVLEKGGIVKPAAQVEGIVKDAVANKVMAANGMVKNHPDRAIAYAAQAKRNGDVLKEAGGPDVKALVDSELAKIEKSVQASTKAPFKIAESLDVIYNGEQMRGKGKAPSYLFTDKKTGTTFAVEKLSFKNVKDRLAIKRKEFEPVKVEEPQPVAINASGESAASLEAISRNKTTKFYVYDTLTKKVRPLIGVDAVDARPGPSEVKVSVSGGKSTLLESGQKVKDSSGAIEAVSAQVSGKVPVAENKFVEKNLLRWNVNSEKATKAKDAKAGAHDILLEESEGKYAVSAKGKSVTDAEVELVLNRLNKVVPEGAKITEGDVAAGSLAFGQKLPETAGNINLNRIGADYSVKKLLVDTKDQYEAVIKRQGRGVVSHETTRRIADNLGMTERDLKRLVRRMKYSDSELLAVRDLLTGSAAEVRKLAEMAGKSGADADLAAFRLAWDRHAYIQGEVSALTAQTGRALQSMRIASSAKNMKDPVALSNAYKKILEQTGGRELTAEQLRMLSTLDPRNPLELEKFLGRATKATTREKLFEIWVNSILSSPTTHAVNTVSNALVTLNRLFESELAALVEFPKMMVGAKRDAYFGEAFQMFFGMRAGVRKGLEAAKRSFLTETPTFQSKIETVSGVGQPGAIEGMKGKLVRIPGRILMAEDDFFKAINYEMTLHARAYRLAMKEGLRGEARAKRIGEIVSEPPVEIVEKATGDALYYTFNKELGKIGKWVQHGRHNIPGLEYIIPFIRTPANIAKFGLERTPLNVPRVIYNLFKGKVGRDELSSEMAKVAWGSLVGTAVVSYVMEGKVTGGGPRDKTEREAWLRSHQPYSVKIGDQWFSYGRLEPLGTVLGLSADFGELRHMMSDTEADDLAAKIALSISQNLTNKTFMQGVSNFINAVSDPVRYGEQWSERLLGSVVPRFVSAFAKATDPVLRDRKEFWDTFKAEIPYLSDDLMPKRNLWGEEIVITDGGFFEILVSPVRRKDAVASWRDRELEKYDVRVSLPTDSIQGYPLLPKEYDRLQKEAGKAARSAVDALRYNDNYVTATPLQRQRMLRDVILRSRDATREKFWNEYGEKLKTRPKKGLSKFEE